MSGALGELPAALAAAGFTQEALAGALGQPDNHADAAVRAPQAVLDRLGTELGAIAGFCLAGRPLERSALPAAAGLGELVVFEGDRMRSLVAIEPYRDLLLVGDVPRERVEDEAYAPAITPSSVTLSRLTVRRSGVRALDLGTGTGIQALLAARHARSVTAVDRNPRALRLAAVAAELNGLDLDLREGDWFEPLALEERFDLITANLPYYIAPDVVWQYAHSDSDEVSRRTLQAAAERLDEGGVACLMVSWGVAEGEDWTARPLEWAEGRGCDALVFGYSLLGAFEYAVSQTPGRGDAEIARWVAHLQSLGVSQVAMGAVVLRRRPGRTWMRAMAGGHSLGDAGEQVERMLAGGDALASGQDVLDLVLAPAPGLVVTHPYRHEEAGFVSLPVDVGSDSGAGLTVQVTPEVARVVHALDGTHSLREVAQGVDAATVAAAFGELLAAGLVVS